MALSDPQVVTLSGSAVSLARTDLAKNKGSFISSTGEVEMTISSTFNAKSGASTMVRIDHKKPIVDPLTNVSRITTASVWLVCRRPDNGTWTTVELADLAKALGAFVATSAYPRVLVGEA
ncbi:coat protein [ssRNA phage SRR6960802_3]|uniref:Coat protein n=1 Tax=ssRNA phage SRR6960802_3 TaxID=2786609 RepID=A0A8S5L0R1_9VIRU|nr:coat protein [ssRNA phage SRR6960802_3]DAD51051.1 TPA_asm: coat protein [ssRNA phage SRR6960802_3]